MAWSGPPRPAPAWGGSSAAHALLAPNPQRLLPATDPLGRQILMGSAAFPEWLVVAAAARGHRAGQPVLAAQPGPPEPLTFQLPNEIGITGQLSGTRTTRLLAPGLNLSPFSVRDHFTRLRGERSLVQLASAMQVAKAAMRHPVTRLQDKGLRAVPPDPTDGRGKLVRLTNAGQAALRQALDLLRRLRQWFDPHR